MTLVLKNGDIENETQYVRVGTAVNHEDWVKQNENTLIQIDPTLQDLSETKEKKILRF